MAFEDFKDLARRTVSDKFSRYKAFNIAKSPKYDRYQRVLASMLYKSFNKKTSVGSIKSMSNQQLANDLQKEDFFLHLKTAIRFLILRICN